MEATLTTPTKNIKVIMAGDTNVGKTQLVLRYIDNIFRDDFYTTGGIDLKVKTFDKDGELIKLLLWDTAGQERFRAFNESNYRGAHGIMIVYDLSNRQSFQNIESWLDNIDKFAPKKLQKILVGAKCDLESQREISFEEGVKFAEKHGLDFMETSAKESLNVDSAFGKLIDQILKNFEVISEAAEATTSKKTCSIY